MTISAVDAMQSAIERREIFAEPPRWRALQAQRLREHVQWCRGHSGLYRDMALGAGAMSGDDPMAMLQHLPLTTKDQVAAAGSDAFGIAPAEAREWVSTSGTTGQPVDVPLGVSDLERLAENEAAALAIAGVGPGDVLVLAVGMDRLFVAGLAYWLGGQKLGATCVRVGPQVGMLEEVCRRIGGGRRIFIVAVPSYLLKLAGAGLAMPKVAGIIAIGEAVRGADMAANLLGANLAEGFGCPVMSTYASTESCTTFAEGEQCVGGHLNPALGILEVLDEAGCAVSDGEVGEVVITPLGVRGLPLLRFRTGDMAASFSATCRCGRTTPRLGPIVGRRQQLLKIRGASIYPGAILEALRMMAGVADSVVIAEHDAFGGDRVAVLVDGTCDSGSVVDKLQATLRVRLEVRLVSATEIAELQRGEGRKVRRFLDRRNAD